MPIVLHLEISHPSYEIERSVFLALDSVSTLGDDLSMVLLRLGSAIGDHPASEEHADEEWLEDWTTEYSVNHSTI